MIPQPDQRTDARIRTTCLVILTLIAVGAALVPLRPVLVPLLVALLFTYCLKPLIEFQIVRLHFPRALAIGGAVLVALVALALAGLIVYNFAISLSRNAGDYRAKFNEMSKNAGDRIKEASGLKFEAPELSDKTMEGVSSGAFRNVMGYLGDLASGLGLVLIFVLFLLVGSGASPPRAGSLFHEIEIRAQRYILQMVGFSVLTGVLVGLALDLIGVEYAFAFGFLAFLLNFIPTVGPLVATLLPLPVVLLDTKMALWQQILAMALPTAIQLTLAVVQPRVQGKGQDLHPVTTMAALVFFGSIWGILGAALAVPVTGVIKIILERIPNTRPIADLMAGRLPQNLPSADTMIAPPSEKPG